MVRTLCCNVGQRLNSKVAQTWYKYPKRTSSKNVVLTLKNYVVDSLSERLDLHVQLQLRYDVCYTNLYSHEDEQRCMNVVVMLGPDLTFLLPLTSVVIMLCVSWDVYSSISMVNEK